MPPQRSCRSNQATESPDDAPPRPRRRRPLRPRPGRGAFSALPVGSPAPDFTTGGALAGQPFQLHLREQLRHGPVVLYFYPRSFTQGCTLEAHAFSEAAADFRRAGARVIGMSADDYDLLAPLLGRGLPQRLPGRDRDPRHDPRL